MVTITKEPKPRLEPINTPTELLEQLKKDIASNRFSASAKRNKIGRLLGFCSVCGTIPEFFMIYICGEGVSRLERYCGPCLEKEKTREYSSFTY